MQLCKGTFCIQVDCKAQASLCTLKQMSMQINVQMGKVQKLQTAIRRIQQNSSEPKSETG